MKPIKKIKKMEKQIYVAPLLEVLPNMIEDVLGGNSFYTKFGDDESGVYLSNESFFDTSDIPDHGSLWDEE